jgi:hypothetical protein
MALMTLHVDTLAHWSDQAPHEHGPAEIGTDWKQFKVQIVDKRWR